MKRILLIAALLIGGGVRADLVASTGSTELRLFDSACSHGGTLARLRPEWRPKFKKAQGSIGGRTFFGCWIHIEAEGVYWVLMENSEGFAADPARFKDEPGV